MLAFFQPSSTFTSTYGLKLTLKGFGFKYLIMHQQQQQKSKIQPLNLG